MFSLNTTSFYVIIYLKLTNVEQIKKRKREKIPKNMRLMENEVEHNFCQTIFKFSPENLVRTQTGTSQFLDGYTIQFYLKL